MIRWNTVCQIWPQSDTSYISACCCSKAESQFQCRCDVFLYCSACRNTTRARLLSAFVRSHFHRAFLKIERIHFQMPLLRWNDDVFDVFANRNQRAGFKIVVSSVCYQIFDAFTRFWKHLHFIEYDERFALVEFHTVKCRQKHEKGIQVIYVLLKIALDLLRTFCKVNQQTTFIFILAKFFADSWFSDTSGTLYQKSFLSIQLLFLGRPIYRIFFVSVSWLHLFSRLRSFHIVLIFENAHVSKCVLFL